MAENSGSADKKTYRGHHCCVYGCSNRQGRENCKFFKVIRNDSPAQTEDWIKKIGRKEKIKINKKIEHKKLTKNGVTNFAHHCQLRHSFEEKE